MKLHVYALVKCNSAQFQLDIKSVSKNEIPLLSDLSHPAYFRVDGLGRTDKINSLPQTVVHGVRDWSTLAQ